MVSDSFNSDGAFDYAKRRLKAEIPDKNYYHNVSHTRQVVSEAEKLASNSGFSQRNILMVKTAAWYHDIAHIEQRRNHEERGVEIVHEVLPQFDYGQDDIKEIGRMIKATDFQSSPESHFQELICDADLHHFGSDNFLTQEMALKREWEESGVASYDLEEWFERTLGIMRDHGYHTEEARDEYKEEKLSNIREIEDLLN